MMRYLTIVVAILILGSMVCAGEAEVAELRKVEIAFAGTMADRDHAAFVAMLSEEAVFWAGERELVGRDAVAAAWKPFFEGPKAPFSWAPDAVAVLDSGKLGFSSGAVRDPEGKQVGVFNSVWRRDDDGSWKIVFDRGCPPCESP